MAELNRLPGIGPRSAERLALHLIQADTAVARRLASVLVTSRDKIIECTQCGGLAEKSPCSICANPARDERTVCVVERAVDILNVEKSGAFRGHYHVLGGKISPMNGVGPEELRVAQLEQRLAECGVKITRIAHGLPAGSGLEFADDLTLCQALEGRRELDVK